MTEETLSNRGARFGKLYATSKRLFDVVLALSGLVVLAPVLVVVAVAIKLDSEGPVFYLGERVGRHGGKFRIFKFRTMCTNAEALGTTTADKDPRMTRVGRFLRRYKLDELPQLINVLKGEMSLVGPRPEVEEHTREYNEEEKLILTVLPGITDYSSIRFVNLGKVLGAERAHEVFVTRYRSEKNQLRLKYVRNRSFREDMRILLLTLLALVRVALGRAGGNGWTT
jgi:lipopolysaccharide/colanic/teichoic acid biosynthesis glycosyltransferase